MSDCTCNCCDPLERVRYFPRQVIRADDMRAEQGYFVDKMRRHNRFLHGWGVVCGFDVVAPGKQDPAWQVTVCPGYLMTPQGDDVNVCDPVAVDLVKGAATPEPCCEPWPCPPRGQMPGDGERGVRIVFVAVRYAECETRPVRVHPAGCGCGCGGVSCEHSRVRESFEFKVLWELPQSHTDAYDHDQQWRKLVAAWAGGGNKFLAAPSADDEAVSASKRYSASAMFPTAALADHNMVRERRPLPVPPCPECADDPWVVLAAVRLPAKEGTPITSADISYAPRRVLWSMSTLMALLAS